MPEKRHTFGRHVIASLKGFLRDVDRGKPIKQTIMRRMVVKGEVKYVSETFEAPMTRRKEKRNGHG